VAIVGNKKESAQLVKLLNNNNPKIKITAFVNPSNTASDKYFAGTIDQLDEIVRIKKIDEIIFCAKNLQSQQIISTMLKLNNAKLDYKIASPDGISVIGSNSINTTGELYNIDINSIVKPENLRNKRMLDFLCAFCLIIIFPILLILVSNRWKMIKNLFSVLFGGKSFVGYCSDKNSDTSLLPKIKKGIFTPLTIINKDKITKELVERLNMMYAKDYKIIQDLNIIIKSWRKLGSY
jgi:hypothetical protein